ncbi:MAG: hypothetical protein OXG56_04935 [Gammaproteobacteria bacterium]|nr:hypothetical protein [Gammaproteobacteria bacterium]
MRSEPEAEAAFQRPMSLQWTDLRDHREMIVTLPAAQGQTLEPGR